MKVHSEALYVGKFRMVVELLAFLISETPKRRQSNIIIRYKKKHCFYWNRHVGLLLSCEREITIWDLFYLLSYQIK